jgi:transmembrane sensor
MTKEEFQDLLSRYTAGKCSLEEIEKVNNWFSKMSDENLELNEFEKSHVNERMLANIRKRLPSAGTSGSTLKRNYFPNIAKLAAAILVVAIVGYYSIPGLSPSGMSRVSQSKPSPENIYRRNSTGKVMSIRLPDSSVVNLQPGAEICYAPAWPEPKREVHLVGEGFFDVVKDSKRPFYVYSSDVVTKVLGTSFTVKAGRDAESIEVSVRTGKVSVYDGTQPSQAVQSGVILTPNEKVEFFVTGKHWVTSLVHEPKPLPTSNKAVEFVFNDVPLGRIMTSIEETYSIDIIVENELAYSKCTFTGDVSMMELYDLLDVICKSTGTTYEVKGTKILITGNGCQ